MPRQRPRNGDFLADFAEKRWYDGIFEQPRPTGISFPFTKR
jgi:hypothetical protein